MVIIISKVKERLVDASQKSLIWLEEIERRVKRDIDSDFKVLDRKYWAPLKLQGATKNFAYFHPQKNQIRMFISLPKSASKFLKSSPATKNWYDIFPGLFIIRKNEDIIIAINIIKAIYLLKTDKFDESQHSILLQAIAINIIDLERVVEILTEIYKKLDDIEKYINDLDKSEFEQIYNLWKDLKEGKISKKEFFLKVSLKSISIITKFINLF